MHLKTHPSREEILKATERIFVLHGKERTTVEEVTRLLGIHRSVVYRHYPNKKLLFEAMIARWLGSIYSPLEAISEAPGPADDRLLAWLCDLIAITQREAQESPKLFAGYRNCTEEKAAGLQEHFGKLSAQLSRILAEGASQGCLSIESEPREVAQTLLDVTASFYHPEMVSIWGSVDMEVRVTAVVRLVMCALEPV